MAKQLFFETDARNKMKRGVDVLANAVTALKSVFFGINRYFVHCKKQVCKQVLGGFKMFAEHALCGTGFGAFAQCGYGVQCLHHLDPNVSAADHGRSKNFWAAKVSLCDCTAVPKLCRVDRMSLCENLTRHPTPTRVKNGYTHEQTCNFFRLNSAGTIFAYLCRPKNGQTKFHQNQKEYTYG